MSGVPGPEQVMAALSRLATLPNPNDPAIPADHRFVAPPWNTVEMPGIPTDVWDAARATVVTIAGLVGTDPYLKRKKVAKHIMSMGQALSPFMSLPLVAQVGDQQVIIDGHHRLCAMMLLGMDEAPVWLGVTDDGA